MRFALSIGVNRIFFRTPIEYVTLRMGESKKRGQKCQRAIGHTIATIPVFLKCMNGRRLEGEVYMRPLADLEVKEGAFGDQ